MAKLPRVHQKIFAENAIAKEIGQFGSVIAGTKKETGDIAEIQALDAWKQGWSKSAVSKNRYPAMQEDNGVKKVVTQQLAYIFQEGIPEWDVETEYFKGSVVKILDGNKIKLYKSLQDNNIGHLITETDWWEEVYFDDPNKLNIDLSNISNEGKNKFDGQWVKEGNYIFQNRTLSTSTSPVQFTISFLPDNDIYELLLYSYITNISNSTFDGIITINTDIIGGAVIGHIWLNTQGALGCSTIVPVSNKRLYIVGASFNSNARGSLSCIGYRKVGASFDTDESST